MYTKIIIDSDPGRHELDNGYELPILNKDVCIAGQKIDRINIENGCQYIHLFTGKLEEVENKLEEFLIRK